MDLSHLKQTLPPDWLSLNIEPKPTPMWMPMPMPMWMSMPMPMLMPSNNGSYLMSDQNNEQVAASGSKRNYSKRLPQQHEDDSVKIKVKKQKKIKTKEKKSKKKIGPLVAMPATTRERIELLGGNDIELFIQKVLEESDVSTDHGRLSLPWKLHKADLNLTENEEILLRYDENDKHKKGMNVGILDPNFKQYTICLKKWKMGSKAVYCLITTWNKFVKETQLEVNDEIQLWRFRIGLNNNNHANDDELRDNSNLCFAFIKLPKRQAEEVDEGSNIHQV